MVEGIAAFVITITGVKEFVQEAMPDVQVFAKRSSLHRSVC